MRIILLFIVTTLTFWGCSNDDELKVDTSIWYIARDASLGNNKLTATFYFFKDGNYAPTTFLFDRNLQSLREGAELTTTSGEKVKSLFIDFVLNDDKGMGTYNCQPGNYYVVVSIGSGINMQWKTRRVTVLENKISIFEVIFKDKYKTGYTEWDE